jgi:hypothetical protein
MNERRSPILWIVVILGAVIAALVIALLVRG